MSSIDHHLTEIYVLADDFLRAHPDLAHWRQSANHQPAFSDVEVLTIALAQGLFQVASLKQTYWLIRGAWHRAFPHLCSYAEWMARLHALAPLMTALLRASTQLPPGSCSFYLIDAKPIPLCHRLRHGRVRLLREDGARFGKTSKGWFFGFKLHLLRHIDGRIVNVVLTPGNWDDREPVEPLLRGVDGGVTLGDLGYRGKQRAEQWAEEADMLVITKADAPDQKVLLAQVRQAIETTLSQLCTRFLDRVYSRSWQGLWNTLQLKLIYYNFCHAGVISA